ncbi:MAG: hypothetical protein KC414_12195, partial [Romboutsia sp.]|nr:hypothetical protein [Romboutsia sp.]
DEPLYFTKEEAAALYSLCSTLTEVADWDTLNKVKPVLDIVIKDNIQDKQFFNTSIFSFQYLTTDIHLQKQLAILLSNRFTANDKYKFKHDKIKPGKINIGYISPDFRNHVVGFLINDLFKFHNRDNFTIHCYSLSPSDDATCKTIMNSSDYFNDISMLSPKNGANKIYNDQIDILVDLAGYTDQCNPELLSYQPAPAQVQFLGQAGTMGAEFIQYHICTETIVPENHLEHYVEQIVYLPNSIIGVEKYKVQNKNLSRELYGLPENKFIMCCFNTNYRIDEEVCSYWVKLLKNIPNSALWLYYHTDLQKENLVKYFEKHDIYDDQLFFTNNNLISESWHNTLADIYVDTFKVTSLTANILNIWADIPVVTLAGDTPASRYGANALSAIDMPELIASTQEEYYNIILELALNSDKLQQIKDKIKRNKQSSVLFNQQAYISQLEQAYALIVEDYNSGNKAKTITVK